MTFRFGEQKVDSNSPCIVSLKNLPVEQELADGKLRRIPMKDFSLWHEISFVWKKDTLFASKIPEVLQWF